MLNGLPLFPESATTMSGRVDSLFFFLLGLTGFISLLVFILIVAFSIKYRRRAPNEIGAPIAGSLKLEILWTIIPFLITLVIFVWGARLFMTMRRPPQNAMEISVVAKQWMWKLQHPEGKMEIDELHVPLGRDIRLNMTSEDVIHDFFVPAFRLKTDVLPGRFTTLWFHPTKIGRYHLFCSQYCGTSHASMGGWVTVMTPVDFEAWLSGGGAGESLEAAGERLFAQHGCANCHLPDNRGTGPTLVGVYGSKVKMQSGETVVADDSYIRDCILSPEAQVVAGYQPVMPSFRGLLDQEQLLQLIAYIRSLKSTGSGVTPSPEPLTSATAAK